MIYSRESQKWHRLTGGHWPRAKQTCHRSADSRALLSFINIWALDEEKFHLKHLQETNMHEYGRYILELLSTLQLRHGTAWLAGYDFPVLIRNKSGRPLLFLARAVLRIRKSTHSDSLHYDMDGLLRTLQARAMLGILEHRVRVYLVELRVGVKSVIKKGQLRSVLRLFRLLGVRGKCDSTHVDVLNMLISACRTGEPSVTVDAATLDAIPRLSVVVQCLRTSLQCLMDRVPRSLADAPVHQRVCWHCKTVVDTPLQKCASCKRARYCSRLCQVADWREHQPACKTAARLLDRELIEAVKMRAVREGETWGSVLCERIGRRLQQS